jgi:hypothetical protein
MSKNRRRLGNLGYLVGERGWATWVVAWVTSPPPKPGYMCHGFQLLLSVADRSILTQITHPVGLGYFGRPRLPLGDPLGDPGPTPWATPVAVTG